MGLWGTGHGCKKSFMRGCGKVIVGRVNRSGKNFPKSILTIFFGLENASRFAFIEGTNSKKVR